MEATRGIAMSGTTRPVAGRAAEPPTVAATMADPEPVTDAYETGRAAEVDTSRATSREDVVNVVRAMATDLRNHKDDWQNASLDTYLDALASSIEEVDEIYPDRGEVVPDQPSWQLVAQLLVMASGYE
jgi:hypothetical protein